MRGGLLFLLCFIVTPAIFCAPSLADIGPDDEPVTVQSLLRQCPYETVDEIIAIEKLPPYCKGFLSAIQNLFHSGEIRYLMTPDQCIDLSGYIPHWLAPIAASFLKHAPEVKSGDAFRFIINAMEKDYPCAKDNLEINPGHGLRPKQ